LHYIHVKKKIMRMKYIDIQYLEDYNYINIVYFIYFPKFPFFFLTYSGPIIKSSPSQVLIWIFLLLFHLEWLQLPPSTRKVLYLIRLLYPSGEKTSLLYETHFNLYTKLILLIGNVEMYPLIISKVVIWHVRTEYMEILSNCQGS